MNINYEKTPDLVLIQITDTHIFTNKNEEFDGIKTNNSLAAILEQIKADIPDLNFMIVTGDLVQEPETLAYKNLLSIMKSVEVPVFYLPGNHDDPQMMNELLGDSFAPKANMENWTFIFLNSHKPESHGGFLSSLELETLTESLEKAKDTNVLIGVHHHPVSIKSPWMDGMMLENASELFAVLDNYQNIKGIIWGHIHQEYSEFRRGVHLMGTPSTCTQFKPGAREYGKDEKRPGYRWLRLSPNGEIKTGIERLKTLHYLEDT